MDESLRNKYIESWKMAVKATRAFKVKANI